LAPWIISHFPPHRVYVEPFGGAASVLLRKTRAHAEVFNDLDQGLVTLFRCLQDPEKSARLIELLRLTPFARDEFMLSKQMVDDPVERSRRMIIRAFMGFGSNAANEKGYHFRGVVRVHTGFRNDSNRSGTTPAHGWANYPEALAAIVTRFAGVVVENRDAAKVMEQFDKSDALHYVDPPYLPSTRAMVKKKGQHSMLAYAHELDRGGHDGLLTFLRSLKGMVVLSGYPSEEYDRALFDWRRVETAAYADGAKPRTEVLWINPACVAALDRQHAGIGVTPLFGGVA
jgi:DNA adenine methylase